jgi:hypothetical protein
MTMPEAHWLSAQDLTTPANDRHPTAGADADGARPRLAEPVGGSGAAAHREPAAAATAVVFLAAVWLVVAAIPVAYRGTGRFDVFWSDVVVGVALAAVALVRLTRTAVAPSLTGITLALGGWLVASPFVLGYGGGPRDAAAFWNDLALGFLVLGLTVFSAVRPAVDRH